jgi:hypothetical protein
LKGTLSEKPTESAANLLLRIADNAHAFEQHLVPCQFSQCQCSAIADTPHHTNILHPSCTSNNSTTTTAMDEAIEALERGGEGEEIGYVAIAKKFGVDESTLRRRHQGKCNTRVEAAQERYNLSTQQEEELVKYIRT